MRFAFPFCLLLSFGAGTPTLLGQPSFAETPGSRQADEAYDQTIQEAERAYAAGREKQFAAWLRGYEKALASAKGDGDLEAVEYLTEAIDRSKQAGFVVLPLPRDAVRFGDHSYALFEEGLPWHVARRRCELMGGHLVTIESGEEETFVARSFGERSFFIGAGDFAKEGEYAWLDGTPFRAFGYATRFDNDKGIQHAICWFPPKSRWDDEHEGASIPYVCEWDR